MLKTRQRLGKYRIDKRLAEGGFAVVYRARDTLEGIPVALKVPHVRHLDAASLDDLRREVRLNASLDHPNILCIKDASYIADKLVIAYPLGGETLAHRMRRRISPRTALDYTEQMLDAVAHAHERRIIHCDIKPENLILFGETLKLADFGIAKIALKTASVAASGSGTIGYLAPEQALGRPSFRSDVFSLGLVIWRLFTGALPEWPFEWPLVGHERATRLLHPDFIGLLRRALSVNDRHRFKDAVQMLAAFRRVKARALEPGARAAPRSKKPQSTWKTLRWKEFQRAHAKALPTRDECTGCGGPVGELMSHCPWCGRERGRYRGPTDMPRRCGRCGRGVKADWRYCAWCWGPGLPDPSERRYDDKRYRKACVNSSCPRGVLLPFSRYCPWCHRKAHTSWPVAGSRARCRRCSWGVVSDFWDYCPWCGVAHPAK